MSRPVRALVGAGIVWATAGAGPAAAQELIDSSTDGGGAFIWFSVMAFLYVAILFAIDRIRRRGEE